MSFSEQVYQELAAVVGERNISREEYVLAGNRAKTPEIPFAHPSPEAIVLPGSTEEVAEIVRICNRCGIKYVAVVTGCIPSAYATGEDTIIIHLKRMNRIVEINDKDRYALIEPGVRHVQLYPEVRKRGLSYAAAAVGPGGSPLVTYSCTGGDNHVQYGTSRPSRYLLGVELVTPEGEILRTGSLQTDSGWFCPESPGPSLRGVVRGYSGNSGKVGIVTKCAIALDMCKGPAEIRREGITPHHKMIMDSDCSRVYVFNYENIQDVCDAIIALGENEIGATVQKYFYLPLTLMMTNSANEFWEKWDTYKEVMSMPLVVHLAAHSVREREYEEKILFDIINETHGTRIPREYEQWWEDHMDYFMIVSRLQSVLRLGGSWLPIKTGAESVQHMCDVGESIGEFIHDFTNTGKIFNAPENYQIIPMEYGHFASIELLFMWDRFDPDGFKNMAEFCAASRESDLKKHYHASPIMGYGKRAEKQGVLYSNCHIWAQLIYEAYNPYIGQ
ncbi:MAG: FAD-dependent oxidoreductase [Clostridiales bacterium]|nr:FAD-dependent oxidoreductase [Clostridiales bacterium]